MYRRGLVVSAESLQDRSVTMLLSDIVAHSWEDTHRYPNRFSERTAWTSDTYGSIRTTPDPDTSQKYVLQMGVICHTHVATAPALVQVSKQPTCPKVLDESAKGVFGPPV